MSLTRLARWTVTGIVLAGVGGAMSPSAASAATLSPPDLAAVTWTAATPDACTDKYEKIPTDDGGQIVRVIDCHHVPANVFGDGLAIRLPGGDNYPYQVTFDNLKHGYEYNWVRRTTAGFSNWHSGWDEGSTTHDCSDTGNGRTLGCIIGANASFRQTVHIKATISLK